MNAERLLAHYEQIAEAPDAITRLRCFVLDLAVRGKLVPQNPNDEHASELMKRISAARFRLKAKHAGSVAPMHEIPFELPPGWTWTRLGEVCSKTGSGSTPRGGKEVYKHSGVPFLRSQNVYDDGLRLDDVAYIDQATHERMGATRVFGGDLLLNITGGSIGRCSHVPDNFLEANVSQHVAIIRVALNGIQKFLHQLILSPYFQHFIFDEQTGAGRGGLPKNKMDMIPIALPPLAEQHRIVAKVEDLMMLCERLEAARLQCDEVRDRLTAASLGRLNALDPESFRDDARFALNALPLLTARANQIEQLRRTILSLGIRGRLVPQNLSDQPASELLKSICKERLSLLNADYPNPAEAKAQKRKQGEQRLPENLPKLASGWTWASLQQCSLIVIDCKNKTAPYAANGIKLIRTTNVRDGKLNSIDQKFVSEQTYEAWSLRAKPEPGDILITREAPMGEVCVVPDGERICLGQRMMLMRLVPGSIEARFMLYSLRDPDLMARVQDKPLGMTVQHLRVGGVETLLVPLPPLAEQRRIVAKIDKLMALCDRLEAALTTAADVRGRLLEALLAEALAPELRPELLQARA